MHQLQRRHLQASLDPIGGAAQHGVRPRARAPRATFVETRNAFVHGHLPADGEDQHGHHQRSTPSPISTSEWIASASITELPDSAAAMNFIAAMARFATIAARTDRRDSCVSRKAKAARFRAASLAAFRSRFAVCYGVCIVPDEPPGPPIGPLVPPVPVAPVSVGLPPGRDVSVPVEVPGAPVPARGA